MQATQSIENVTLSLPIDSTSKVIKKIGYGYKNFYYFRNRLMYNINLNEPLKEIDINTIPKAKRK